MAYCLVMLGKRSMCDQLEVATNYKTHQKEKIQKLRATRDKLKSALDVHVRCRGDGSGIEVLIGGVNESGVCVADVVAFRFRGEVMFLFMLSRFLIPLPPVGGKDDSCLFRRRICALSNYFDCRYHFCRFVKGRRLILSTVKGS
ncbi:hypothetical protein AMTR_s00001p00269070 [Amborella trichopoda]|uniref:Uncharacterized protein n=1 Tax=Amborella trichopoda TaxID=13333 RepID=W1NLY5_AMBTC|nr:hypothetical protein AMTR_s00001p00269070 [Amborella trichopoda]